MRRRRRIGAEAGRLAFELEHSGLRRRSFCAQHGLSVATLDNYRKRRHPLEHRRPQSQTASSRIVPVELVNSIVPTVFGSREPHCAMR